MNFFRILEASVATGIAVDMNIVLFRSGRAELYVSDPGIDEIATTLPLRWKRPISVQIRGMPWLSWGISNSRIPHASFRLQIRCLQFLWGNSGISLLPRLTLALALK